MNQTKETKTIQLQKLSLGWIVAAILSAIGSLFFFLWNDIWISLLQIAFDKLPKSAIYNSFLLLLVLLLSSLLYAFYLRPKNIRAKYNFDKRSGILIHKKTGEYFCLSCFLENGIESPLKEKKDGWYCLVKSCSQKYPNPDYKKSTFRPRVVIRIRGINDYDPNHW
jgi:hypothetical protein